ncbi:uncharacterized protein FOMMEDRAFT_139979 [Fomitiporia mediterranea MF3/22]|uniref:uncharacterized protein n=1 Tax=Fomitiporia mediterranea (strain MF3/22) TaxID=694068 RepID=UPI0004408E66|nr:uncharacterized protein FOMMEDRAFT_139979 [Fomitiporia mediterranea MF3/22]EJD03841.1 hypothetical protein FOMMEDRAFT_139979 [Fomitiporia mediterranea MF3/22]
MDQTPRNASPPPRSLNRQVVLDEDEYTEALSHIIARDFFPSLVHLDATNNYLDALRTEDPQLINASVRQLQDLATPAGTSRGYQPQQTPSQTPWAAGPSDTPLAFRSATASDGSEPPTKRARYDTNMSLDSFQAKYTSEDNSSFTQILEDENRVRREKYGWAWDAQRRVEVLRERMLEAREKMLIEPAPAPGVKEKRVIEAPKPVGLITAATEEDTKEEGNEPDGKDGEEEDGDEKGKEVAVVSQQDEEEVVDVMAPKKDTRSAGVDGWKFKTRNAFMFPPDADVAPHDLIKPGTPAAPTRGEPKAIKHGNTRLPEQSETSSGMSEPPSPTRSRIDAAIMGTPYRPRSPTNNGFSLLPSVPSPTPAELGPAAVKQLMTWGTLNATPRVLTSDDPADAKSLPPPSTPFHLPPPTSRETIGHKLSNKAVKSLRAKAVLMGGRGTSSGLGFRTPVSTSGSGTRGEGGSMPPPSWTPRKAEAAGSLTPAAKRLLDRTTMGAAATRRAEAMGKTAGWESSSASKAKEKDLNKVRWTPSPAPLVRKR